MTATSANVFRTLSGVTRADGTTSLDLGDGLTLRLLSDGTVRLRAANHQIRVAWLTNKPDAGSRSVLGAELVRKG